MSPRTDDAIKGREILLKTVEIIAHLTRLNPATKFYMENPQGMMQHETDILSKLPVHQKALVSYCRYGFDYRKNTHIWTNDEKWAAGAKSCSSGHTDGAPCRFERAGYCHCPLPNTLKLRYRIPPRLLTDIFKQYGETKKKRGYNIDKGCVKRPRFSLPVSE
jgi:hypothetical protein